MTMKPQLAALLILIGSLPGCSERTEAAVPKGGKGGLVDSSGGTVALGLGGDGKYRPTTLSASGSVGGTISLQGVSADRTIGVTRDTRVCGDSASLTETRANGNALANVLVWVEGIESGKPFASTRRETLLIERCRFEPRLMAVATGTTINVFSRDPAVHTSQFFRERASEPVEEIYTMDAGQVVPSEKIAREPGIVEVRHTQHQWTRAYIAVFDHPYFAVTDDNGMFRIDSLPPGTYTMKVWHERMDTPGEQRVVVAPGGVGRLELTVTLK
jgi:hypothetical protein